MEPGRQLYFLEWHHMVFLKMNIFIKMRIRNIQRCMLIVRIPTYLISSCWTGRKSRMARSDQFNWQTQTKTKQLKQHVLFTTTLLLGRAYQWHVLGESFSSLQCTLMDNGLQVLQINLIFATHVQIMWPHNASITCFMT